MAKRRGSLTKKTKFTKKSPKRLEAKKKMLEIKAMKPAERKKALAELREKRIKENNAK